MHQLNQAVNRPVWIGLFKHLYLFNLILFTVWSWKLSRTKELTDAATNAINAKINSIDVLDQIYYQPRDQTRDGCFFYPEPVLGEPVIFPGQCDEQIPVVLDFQENSVCT